MTTEDERQATVGIAHSEMPKIIETNGNLTEGGGENGTTRAWQAASSLATCGSSDDLVHWKEWRIA